MKILLDARLYGLENAGLGRYLINLISELSQLDSKNEYIVLLRKKYFDDLELPSNWKKILTDFHHYSFTEQIKLPFIINSIKPDICHFPHFNIPIFYCLAGNLFHFGNFVVTIHDLLMHKQKGLDATTLSAPIYFIKRLGYRFVFDLAVWKATKIIVPSLQVKKELIEFYKINPDKIVATYEGLDQKIESSNKSPISDDYFIYTGNAYPHKNLERVVGAIVELNKNLDKKILFVIASARNVFTQKLQTVVTKLKAEKYVKLLGFVPDSDLGSLYKNSLAFVFPSLSEGFGLPGLEAMNAGTLVLASDIPVFREIYNTNAIYFDPLNSLSMEQAMKNVLNLTQAERKIKIASGQDFVKRYSWSKMAKQTLDVYEGSHN